MSIFFVESARDEFELNYEFIALEDEYFNAPIGFLLCSATISAIVLIYKATNVSSSTEMLVVIYMVIGTLFNLCLLLYCCIMINNAVSTHLL